MKDPTELESMVRRRRSCRAFLPDQLPAPMINRIVETAAQAPSWSNTQPWHVVVTSGRETELLRKVLSGLGEQFESDLPFPGAYPELHRRRRRESAWQLYDAVGVKRGDREASARQTHRNFEFFGAPHFVLLTTERELGVYGVLDCGAFLQTFLLAAEALGVAACAQGAIAGHASLLRDWFDLPANRVVVCGISFGYADAEHASTRFRTRRAPLDEVFRVVAD